MKYWMIVFTAIFLAACEQESPEKTVWDEQLKTMEKAREAEQQIMDSAVRQRKLIEQQTQQ